MADLRFTGRAAVVDAATDHQPAADTAAQGHVEDWIGSLAGTQHSFAQSGDVRIVVGEDGCVRQAEKPAGQIEVRPSLDLVGAGDPTGVPIDRATEADPDGIDALLGPDSRDRLRDSPTNAFCGRLGGDIEPEPPENGSVGFAQNELELGAADFDAEDHAGEETRKRPGFKTKRAGEDASSWREACHVQTHRPSLRERSIAAGL